MKREIEVNITNLQLVEDTTLICGRFTKITQISNKQYHRDDCIIEFSEKTKLDFVRRLTETNSDNITFKIITPEMAELFNMDEGEICMIENKDNGKENKYIQFDIEEKVTKII